MDQHSLHHEKSTFRPHDTYEKVRRLLDFEKGPQLKILDVGCGPGVLDQRLRQYGHNVLGLDTFIPENPENIPGHVDFKNPNQFLQCDINQKWPVADSEFDLVICTDVPEHLYDPGHVLDEARRVLKQDGKLIFGVPNHFDLRQRLRMLTEGGIVHWDNLQYGENAWHYAHIRFFNLRDLRAMFAEYNWQIDTLQLNFMGGGIIPTRFTPPFLRGALLRAWPALFSGKFIVLASTLAGGNQKQPQAPISKRLYLNKTPFGL